MAPILFVFNYDRILSAFSGFSVFSVADLRFSSKLFPELPASVNVGIFTLFTLEEIYEE